MDDLVKEEEAELDAPPSDQSPKDVVGPCAICGRSGHGIHFGVLACRACAAFYRRTIVMKSRHNCRRATGNCPINKDERVLCRLCRFKKCLEKGMREDNVQFPRNMLDPQREKTPRESSEKKETVEVTSRLELPPPPPPPPPLPAPIPAPVPTSLPSEPTLPTFRKLRAEDIMVIDTTEVLREVEAVFCEPPPVIDTPIVLTALQRMQHALHEYRKPQSATPIILEKANCKDMNNQIISSLRNVAKMMVHCEEFTMLPKEDKMAIIKYAWTSMIQLERVHQTILLYGPILYDRRIMVFNFKEAMDCDRTALDMAEMTQISSEDVKRMFDPSVEMLFKDVVRPMLTLKVSELEVVYLLCLVMWNIDGLKVCKTSIAIADAYKSNELHDFYVYHMRTPNYAARLIKLMNIVQAGERVTSEKIRLWDIGRLFDVFKVDITCPDLFRLDS